MLISFLFFMIYCNVVHVVKNQKAWDFQARETWRRM